MAVSTIDHDTTDVTTTPAGVGAAGGADDERSNLLMVGTFLAIAAATMLMGALLGDWLAARADALDAGSPWLREGVDIPNLTVAVTYLTLLMSSFTAQWAVYSANHDDRTNLYVAVGITLVLGIAFVNGLSFVFDSLGLEAGMTDVANATYAVTVTHLLLVIAAHLVFVVMGFRALTGQVSVAASGVGRLGRCLLALHRAGRCCGLPRGVLLRRGSRMIPTGSKFWFGVTAFAVAATVVYFLASGGEGLGSMVLLALAFAAFTLGLLSALIGDGDAEDPRSAAGEDDGEAVVGTATGGRVAVQLAAAWPAFAAVGAAVAAVGLAAGGILFYIGLILILVAGAEWMVQAWAERSTDDPARNRELRNRIMYPIEFPVLAVVLIAVVIVSFSRVLLAVSKVGSTVLAIVVASVILAAAFMVTSRPRLTSSLLTAVVALGAVLLIGGASSVPSPGSGPLSSTKRKPKVRRASSRCW